MGEGKARQSRLSVVQADITTLAVDAVVNAANRFLSGGAGVDGAIHRAGGPEIMRETRERFPQGCPPGSAVTTGAGELPASWVVHAVAPVWLGGNRDEDALLAGAWRAALDEAVAHGATSVAIPSLGTGAYGFPLERAAAIAAGVVREFVAGVPDGVCLDITVCAFSDRDAEVYRRALGLD